MLRQSSFILFLVFGLTANADQQENVIKIKSKPPALDLIQESNSLQVLAEQPVQEQTPEARHIFGFNVGQMAAQSLTLTSNGETIHYDLDHQTPFFSGQLGYFPARFNGYWGLLSTVGYSYREQTTDYVMTALHLLSGDILFAYRYERDERSWVKPFIGVGPGINIAIQRGIDQVNTSEAHGIAVGALGAGFNVTRLFKLSSPIDWELSAQYKRWVDIHPSNANYNAELFSLGLAMSL